ncbi:allophanate hydrolase [Sphingopyxis panaciterrae]|uniref:5-oxoprolinase subunit C family protein n=1 Tax=Sphingopyxis panaciterrae TaxID=363841 RepID=UPI001420EBCE|nr:biotin-dependent carboxyltransferase family protein [Sphingopyxis panaciterrae]NIJ35980.1 allophanate hydrolase [Sphingopyxis panaciterrae]
MTASLHIENAGPLTSVQDGGRRGHMRFGVPASGPVDRFAFAAANAALGNAPGAALLEISAGGIALRCAGEALAFALCGGDFTAEIDGRSLGGWLVERLEPGQRLRIKGGAAGNWAYLAFSGRIDTDVWLGSQATHALSGLGGGILRPGAAIVVEDVRTGGQRPGPLPAIAASPIETARIVLGPQERFFAPASLEHLANTTFHAGAAFDRMGRKFEGPALPPLSLDMPSEPAVRGALQVDGAGQLTLLLADHQTIGGYPKIAVVVEIDIDRIAQLPAGAPLRFEILSQAEAIALMRRAAREEDLLKRIASRPDLDERLRTINLIDGMVDAGKPDSELPIP